MGASIDSGLKKVAAVQTVEQAMPLERLKDDHRVTTGRGVEFWMADEVGSLVCCRVSHEALRDQAARVHFEGSDDKVFEAYRELIEQVASASRNCCARSLW